MSAPTPALAIAGLSKRFGGATALDNVGFSVAPGTVHGLLGHNGSGKSTLVKVLAGFHAPESGAAIAVHGRALPLPLPAGSFRRFGLSFVHQNLGLVPSLTVLENLRVASLIAPRLRIDWRAERAAAKAALARFGLGIDPDARIADLGLGDRALIAIVRAAQEIAASRAEHGTPGVLILDEPTPFLPRPSVARLFALVRDIVREGGTVIFISHDIGEVLEITDAATVLRDGRVAGTIETARTSREEIIRLIVGHDLAPAPVRAAPHAAPVVAAVRGLKGPRLGPIDFTVHAGEILGLAGLIGSGFERVPGLLAGAAKAEAGTLEIAGRTQALAGQTPARAQAAQIALLPADRNRASGVGSLSVLDNMMLPDLRRHLRGGFLSRRSMRTKAEALSAQYEVRPRDPELRLSALSGGNAQKVLLAKWMNLGPRLLLLEEPTQGVDIGSREQVYVALRAAAATGTAIVCASSDHEQLADLCDRVLVFCEGRCTAELRGAAITKEQIAAHCYAGATAGAA